MALSVGIDLGSRSLKVVAGRKKGHVFELQRAFMIPLDIEKEPEEALEEGLLSLSQALGKASGFRFSVSGRDLIIRYTKVPEVPVWRLRRLMQFELRDMSDQAGEALAADYNLISLPGAEEANETVLVAVVKEPFLHRRYEILRKALGEPLAGMPSSIALFNSYLHSGELHEGEFIFLVDLGDRNVEFVLEKDGELLFARNIAAGGRQMTEAIRDTFGVSLEQALEIKANLGNVTPKGKASYGSSQEEKVANALMGPVGQLASMIQSSLAFSRAQTGLASVPLGRILLSGGGAGLKGLEAYLASTFECPVERFLPESGLDLGPLDGEEAAAFEGDPGCFAVALGLALAAVDEQAFIIDLVPEAVQKRRTFLGRTLFLYLSGLAALVFVAATWISLSGQTSQLKKKAVKERVKASRANRERQEYQRERERIRLLRQKRGKLNRQSQGAWACLRALKLIQEACPEGVWVESLSVKQEARALNPKQPRGLKRLQTLVRVQGEIVSLERQADEALQELKRRLQGADPGLAVSIEKQHGGAARSSRKLDFVLLLDFFPAHEEGRQT